MLEYVGKNSHYPKVIGDGGIVYGNGYVGNWMALLGNIWKM